MAVSKRTRFEVLRRDNFTCRYCRSAEGELTVDHVTPVALGGTDDPSNLVAACRDCNMGKASTRPDDSTVANVADDAIRWAAAIKQAGAAMVAAQDEGREYVDAFLEAWPQYRYVPKSLLSTVEAIRDAGLPVEVMLECAAVASSARGVNDRAAYFAGMCWRRVRQMQEVAAQIVAEGGE